MTAEQPVTLAELAGDPDLDQPADGWAAELGRRGVVLVEDDVGRPAVERSVVRAIYAEARSQREAVARKRAALEQEAVERDRAFRASLPRGVAAAEVPAGMTAAAWLMASEPVPAGRVSVVEDALAGGGVVYHPVGGES
jgi:hypothetical protein